MATAHAEPPVGTLRAVDRPADPRPVWTAEDEAEHPGSIPEEWWWWGWTTDPGTLAGWFVGLSLRGRSFDYWAGVVGLLPDRSYLYLAELDGRGRRHGLELKPAELWADHECDRPFRQWSIGNEGYAVALDDPDAAWDRAYGERMPLAIDVEWLASGPPDPLPGTVAAVGYEQLGEFDALIEWPGGPTRWSGPCRRAHVWGATMPADPAPTTAHTVPWRAPLTRADGRRVEQTLSEAGWWHGDAGHLVPGTNGPVPGTNGHG